MVNIKTKLTIIAGLFVAGFVVLVGVAGIQTQDNSTADTEATVNCVSNNQLTFNLPPDKFERMVVNTNTLPAGHSDIYVMYRTVDLGADLQPGLYEVWTTSSDDHNDHGYIESANTPGHPSDDQPNEEYYVIIGDIDDGAKYRAPEYSIDVPGNADWVAADGQYFKDDNDTVFDGSPEVEALTNGSNGSYGVNLGRVLLEETRSQVTFVHRAFYEPEAVFNIDSVIPHSVFFQCIEPLSSDLAIQKTVDGNSDGQFNEEEEIQEDQEFTWRIVASNSGLGDELNAAVIDQLPNGVSLVPGSAQVVKQDAAGPGTLTETLAPEGVRWVGQISSDDSVEIEFKVRVTDHLAFADCEQANGLSDQCQNTAQVGRLDDQNVFELVGQDPATVTLAQPQVAISKAVDANDDQSYSKIETILPKGGDSFDWQITISNTGNGIAHDYVMVDAMPAGVDIDGVSATVGSIENVDNTAIWKGDIASGQQIVVDIQASVASLEAFLSCDSDTQVSGNNSGDSICRNVAELGAQDPTDSNSPLSPVSDFASVNAVLASNLGITKFVDGIDDDSQTTTTFSDEEVELIEDGTRFSWKIVGENTGDAPATGVRMVDEIAPGVVLDPTSQTVQVNGPGTAEIVVDNGKTYILWNGDLAVDETVELVFTTVINNQSDFEGCDAADGTTDGICSDPASIGLADTTVLGLAPDDIKSDSAYVNANFNPVYEIKKFVDADNDSQFNDASENGAVDTTVKYRIIASNVGNGRANNARVIDVLNPGVILVSDVSDINATTNNSNNGVVSTGTDGSSSVYIAWDGALEPGEEIIMEFDVRVENEDDYTSCLNASVISTACRNIASAGNSDSAQPWLITDEVSDPADVVMNPTGDLVLNKLVDTDNDGSWSESETIRPNEQFSWRVELTNQGDGSVNNAAMADVLPEGVSIVGEPRTEPADFGRVTLESGTRQAVFWNVERFRPGESVAIVFDAIVSDYAAFDACDVDDGDSNERCLNLATAGEGSDLDDFQSFNITDTADVDIEKYPELSLVKTVDASNQDGEFSKVEVHSTSAGQNNITWKSEVTNVGNATAVNANFSDVVDSSMTVAGATVNGVSDAGLVVDGNSISWSGDIEVGQTAVFTITANLEDDDFFVACDTVDGSLDDRCMNTASVSYPVTVSQPGGGSETTTETLDSSASISLDPSLPVLGITKDVDADADGLFEDEENYVIGTELVWRVQVRNTGIGPAKSIRVEDPIISGQRYIEGSATADLSDGSSVGQPTVADGKVEWRGDLQAGQTLVIEFSVRILSLQDFATCNFADGDPLDERCGNTANLYADSDDSDIAATSPAKIITELPVVLAVTGVSGTGLSVGVGLTIALIAISVAVASVFIGRTSNDQEHNAH